MVNPDIRFNQPPPRTSNPSQASRPAGPPSGSKNFEKVMRRDSRGSKEDESDDDKIKENKGSEGQEGELEEASDQTKEKPSSIFDLSRSGKQKPLMTPKDSSEGEFNEEMLTGIAEGKKMTEGDKMEGKPSNASLLAQSQKSEASSEKLAKKGEDSVATLSEKGRIASEEAEKKRQASDSQLEKQLEASKGKKALEEEALAKMGKKGGADDELAESSFRKKEGKEGQADNRSDLAAQTISQERQQPLVNPIETAKAQTLRGLNNSKI